MPPASASKPRIVYLHGDGVLYWSWGWVARLRTELQNAGFPTFFELFPDSIEARAKYWMPFLRDHVRVTERDVLLGWSCGAVAALRLAEEQPVAGLALVAPYYTDLGLEAVRRAGWVDRPWSWTRIRQNAPRISMFQSDSDPYISQDEFAALADNLGADVHLVPGAGHFSGQAAFPELSDHLQRTYG
jgi:predicted alpha/beta hydrolase family esterase